MQTYGAAVRKRDAACRALGYLSDEKGLKYMRQGDFAVSVDFPELRYDLRDAATAAFFHTSI
jgi:hypothetical protein